MSALRSTLAEIEPLFAREAQRFTDLADRIWGLAELRYAERESMRLHADALAAAGFSVQPEAADIPTAFIAEAGSGGPVIGLLGEYDALSGLNQEAGALFCCPSPDSPGHNGHGCGHHLLGSAAHLSLLGAGLLVAWRRWRCTTTCAGARCPGACASTAARRKKAARARHSWRAPACSPTSTPR